MASSPASGSWVMLGPSCLPLPLWSPSRLQQPDPPQGKEEGVPGPAAQEAGFKAAPDPASNGARGHV